MSIIPKLNDSANYLRSLWGDHKPDLAVVLGSGFKSFADKVEVLVSANLSDIPNFIIPKVQGHGASILLARCNSKLVVLVTGRVHMYEGYSASDVCYTLRTLARTGIKSVVLTNAAGGLTKLLNPGDILVLKDQINLTGQTCLNETCDGLGPRFVDMTDCFNANWRRRIKSKNRFLKDGVYLGVLGAAYETPAETAFFAMTGANIVGMSTVQETIAARQMGLKVLALSFVTNLAGGLSKDVSHDDVIRIGEEKAPLLHRALMDAIETAP